MDKDERAGLQRITKTFESVRSNIATAWNKAMIWIDDEVVFARLNTLLTVAKEATNRVIEAALRAEKNAADAFSRVQADPDGLALYNADRQPEAHQESVKGLDIQRTYWEHPLLDQDIVTHGQGTLTTAFSETRPLETKQTNATNDTYEPMAKKKKRP